jgi:cytoskeletal protein RodZ
MSEPTQEQPAVTPEVTTAPVGGRWSRIPHHLGRARTSTVVLGVLFLAIFALYLNIRPETTGTATTETGNTAPAQAPASTSESATPTTPAPETTEEQPPTTTGEPSTTTEATETTTVPETTTESTVPTPAETSTLPTPTLTTPAG